MTDPNSVCFSLNTGAFPVEMLRLDGSGFHYKGKVIEDAGEAYNLFKQWLVMAQQPSQEAEPVAGKVVAWGVFANIDGEWQLQHPVFAGDEQGKVNAEFERASYSGPQPLEVRPLGVVTATAPQAEPVQDQRCRAEPRSDGDFVCDCKIGDCLGRSAALAQQAEPTVTEDMKSAVRWAPSSAYWSQRLREFFGPDAREGIDALERRLAKAQQAEQDLSRCPQCNGPADNGFDRSFPPSPYLCTKCMAKPAQDPTVWVASKDGRVIYDDASTDDGLLRVSGDFENDEQRVRYAQRIVDKLNAAPPQRKLVPLTEGEISAMAQKTWKLSVYYDAFSLLGTDNLVALVRAVEKAVWEKNHGQA